MSSRFRKEALAGGQYEQAGALHPARCILHAACCMLHAACCARGQVRNQRVQALRSTRTSPSTKRNELSNHCISQAAYHPNVNSWSRNPQVHYCAADTRKRIASIPCGMHFSTKAANASWNGSAVRERRKVYSIETYPSTVDVSTKCQACCQPA